MRGVLPLLLLASCAAPPPPRPADRPATREEALEALASLEATFYEHRGALEARPEFRRLRAGHAPHLRAIADANGPSALMAMRLLARLAPEERFTDDARAIVYASALERERNYIRWGAITKGELLPGVYAHELLGLGPAAVPYLRKLLSSRRPAPVLGGEPERVNRRQQDRVGDYAWVFLARLLGRPIVYAEDPRDRDDAIRAFERGLDAGK